MCIYQKKEYLTDDVVVEIKIWKLPKPSSERPHGYKYSLHCGTTSGHCIVRYDNEAGKGSHRHYGSTEELYSFSTLENLIEDFLVDVRRLTP